MAPRPLLCVVLAVLLLVPDWTGPARLPLLDHDVVVHAERVPLDPRDPARRRLGRLTFMGGVALTSRDPAFGGFSALTVRGDRVVLLSDGGNVVTFRLSGDGRPYAVRAGALGAGPGTGWRKQDRDSESLAIDPRTGTAWVGFERTNAIFRFRHGLGGPGQGIRPRAMWRWTENGGPESLIRRRDGSFVAIQEEAPHGGATRALLVWRGDPVADPEPALRLRYRPSARCDPSDATELPDGRLLVLARCWSFPLRFTSVLDVVARDALRPGALVRGARIATLAAPLTNDNWEGIAATVEGGRTIVWLVSDDNQAPLERTLLMKFRLE